MSSPDIKLKKISLLNFRGSRDLLDLDLGDHSNSCAIFGHNGEGKSTFTHALEWFFVDRIAILSGEGIYEEDIINLSSSATDETSVNLVFNKKELNSSKIYDKSKKKSKYTNSSVQFTTYLENEARYDRLYLDHRSMLWFLMQPKGKKKEEIAKIVGYEEIIRVKATTSATLRYLDHHSRFSDAQRRLSQNQGLMTKEIFGEAVNDIDTLLLKSAELLKILGISSEVKSIAELDAAIQKVFQGLPDQKKAQERVELENLQGKVLALEGKIDFFSLLEGWVSKYNTLVSDKKNLSNINLNDFLRQAERTLTGMSEIKECPLCEQHIDNKDGLLKKVIERYRVLSAVKEKLDTCQRELVSFVSNIQLIEKETMDFFQALDLKKIPYEAVSSKDYIQKIRDIKSEFESKFHTRDLVSIDIDSSKKIINSLHVLLNTIKAQLITRIQSLITTEEEKTKHITYGKLLRGKNIVLENIALQKEIELFKHLIKDMRIIEAQMLELQNTTMAKILDLLSQDVNKFFCYLNKKERIKNVKLSVTGEEGIEFSLEFYDRVASPPKKYLSESQLNSLGISFFLAAVKKFNKANKFFVLDDVLISFDRNYRLRLLDLLAEEFSDYQILLLTHEEFWFHMMRRKFPNWVFKEVNWSFDNGIHFRSSLSDSLEDIIEKHTSGQKIGNGLRIYMESLLKDICVALEVKLPFRLGSENERRMIGELFPALTNTLAKHKTILKDIKEYRDLEVSAFITTASSHHNPDLDSFGDMDETLEKVKKFRDLFICPKGKMVSKEIKVPGQNKIACKCGCLQIDWKE